MIRVTTDLISMGKCSFRQCLLNLNPSRSLLLISCYSVLDLAVDVMGIADRSRGSYGLVRSAGMGYFFGDGDDSACRSLHSGLHGDPYCADDEGGFFPLSMIRPINRNELGGTVRLGGASGLNPLLDRYVFFLYFILQLSWSSPSRSGSRR